MRVFEVIYRVADATATLKVHAETAEAAAIAARAYEKKYALADELEHFAILAIVEGEPNFS